MPRHVVAAHVAVAVRVAGGVVAVVVGAGMTNKGSSSSSITCVSNSSRSKSIGTKQGLKRVGAAIAKTVAKQWQ